MWAGRTALITGATSGLGWEFAQQLAARGVHLCLVARRLALLQQHAAELSSSYGVRAEVIALDLAHAGASAELHAETRMRGLPVDILVQAAGTALWGDFVDLDDMAEEAMLQLNMLSLAQLCRYYVRDMLESGKGHVLLVSGMSAFQPTPSLSSFAASKAFVQSLGESMAYELKNQGITVTVLASGGLPGEVLRELGSSDRRTRVPPQEVVRMALLGMEKGLSVVIPGKVDRAGLLANRLVPRRLVPPMIHRLLKSSVTRH